MSIVPTAFLFRYRSPVVRDDRLPRSGKTLLDLPESAKLTLPSTLDVPQTPWELRAAWNPDGIGFQVVVSGRTMRPLSNPDAPAEPDSLELWIDTRDTQSVHRATRYCHHFAVLPTGGGKSGDEAIAVQLPVARAKEDAPIVEEDVCLTRSRISKSEYQLEVWIPSHALHGFDPASQPRLGFTACLNDSEHGRLSFGVDQTFPYPADPSLWHSLELVG